MTRAKEIEPLDMGFEEAVRKAVRTKRPEPGKVKQGHPDTPTPRHPDTPTPRHPDTPTPGSSPTASSTKGTAST